MHCRRVPGEMRETDSARFLHWLFVVIAIITCAATAEALGTWTFQLGPLQIVVLPLLTAFVMTAVLNIVALRTAPLFAERCQQVAGLVMGLLALLFVLRAGLVFGENLPLIIDNGSAMVFQSIGKIGTLLAFPLAMMLGMRRASIGATFSIGREPSLAIIQQRYGVGSPEMTGVLTTYVTGTVFGAIFFSIVAAVGSWLGYSTQALTMACGTGSGGMTFSCAGSLTQLRDDMDGETILALATASDVLSYVATILLGTFVAIPVLERLTRAVSQRKRLMTCEDVEEVGQAPTPPQAPVRQLPTAILSAIVVFAIVTTLTAIGQSLARAIVILAAGIGLVGVTALIRIIPRRIQRYLPLPILAAVVGILAGAPAFPWATTVSGAYSDMQLLTIASGVLACAGLAINRQQIHTMKKFGWRAVAVAFAVFAGSYFVSATLAQLAL
ncbi:DUF3100 domain-containing protein [Brevibacterium luteolum]|uniref:DUF3100 domain-containing protein n=1 Tax=Brevibacterium luteolum TaxID=199591 RepID=A0A6G8KTK2_9MICO|nr:DUF3100 domain-containing protein [Brevibacterium luteolum]